MEGVDIYWTDDGGRLSNLFYPTCLVPSLDILLFRIRCVIPYEQFDSLYVITRDSEPERQIWMHKHGFAENVKSKAPIGAELIHCRAYIGANRCASVILLLR